MATQLIESSTGLECSFRTTVNRVRRSCVVVSATIHGIFSDEYLEFPCFHCSSHNFNNNYDNYSRYYQQRFSSSLYWSNFNEHLPRQSATAIARDFSDNVLLRANSGHRCSDHYSNSVYSLEIRFRILDEDSAVAFDRAVMDSFEQAPGPTKKPVSVSYVSELIKARDEKVKDDEGDSSLIDHECSICIDEIDKVSNSLLLECSHVFHDKCILQWFEENHVCPLCRFQMPTET